MTNYWLGRLTAMSATISMLLASPASPAQDRPSQPTLASTRASQLDARSLALSDTKRSYCTKLAPSQAGEFETQAKFLERGTSRETLAKLRASGAYKSIYDAEAAFLESVPPENGVRLICARNAPPKK